MPVVEPADVRGEPGNPGDSHVDACRDLTAEVRPRGRDVARPCERAVPLTPRPHAAHEVDHVGLPCRDLALVEGAGERLRIEVADLEVRPQVIAVVVEVVDGVLGLCLVEPEGADPQVVVVAAAEVPEGRTGLRVGRVEEDARSLERHLDVDAALGAHEEVAPLERVEVLRVDRHLRPDRHHELHPELLELGHHRRWIRPELVVEPIVAHRRPVEEVSDDDVQRHTTPVVLAGDVEQLLLVPVPQLALPVAEAVLRHHRGVPGRGRIGAADLGRGGPGGDPVVELLRGLRRPLRAVGRERSSSDRRVVPEEAVAEARHHERDAGLRVAMGQLERAALEVQDVLLVLPHPVQLLHRAGFERRQDPVVSADDRLVAASLELEGPPGGELAQQGRSRAIAELDRTAPDRVADLDVVSRASGEDGDDAAVREDCRVAVDVNVDLRGRRR